MIFLPMFSNVDSFPQKRKLVNLPMAELGTIRGKQKDTWIPHEREFWGTSGEIS